MRASRRRLESSLRRLCHRHDGAFIVLWLMSADDDVKKAISAFFSNPSGPGSLTARRRPGAGKPWTSQKQDMKKLREKIQQALMNVPNFKNMKDHVEITVTADGLRIELGNRSRHVLRSGKPAPYG